MSIQYTDIWKDVLQNLSGKTVQGNFQELPELLSAFNDLYLCKVTFSTTPANATVTVKDSKGASVAKQSDDKFHLKEGSYTYSASAEGYTPVENQSLTISNIDEQTGSKTVTVTLTQVVGG